MSKQDQIEYLKSFISLWNKTETSGELAILSDVYSVFTDSNRLPSLSADELLIELTK